MRHFALGIILICIAGCATNRQAALNQEGAKAYAADQAYCEGLLASPTLDPIRSKVPIGQMQATFDMLANAQYATPEDRQIIREWANLSIQCQTRFIGGFQRFGTPTQVVMYSASADQINALRLQLHNGDITFGQYSQARQKANSDYQIAWANYNAELARQNESARFRAAQVAHQYQQNSLLQQQLLQQQQQAFLQRMQVQQQQHGQVTCQQIGQFTYCNY